MNQILTSKLRCIQESNDIMRAFLFHISKFEQKVSKKSIKIYDYIEDKVKFYDIKALKEIERYLNLAYFDEWQKKINFDKQWYDFIEKKFLVILDQKKLKNYFEFCIINYTNEKGRISSELTQIFVQTVKKAYVDETKLGLESSWFYLEFGRILSEFYIKKAYNLDDEKMEKIIKFIEAIDFKDDKLKAFIGKSKEVVHFFNDLFSKNFDITYSDIIEHFLLFHVVSKRKKNVSFYNKLNLQYVEYSSLFINDILCEYFEQENIIENNKTYKIFKPNGIKKIPNSFNLNRVLPSIVPEYYSEDKISKYFTPDEHIFDIFLESKKILLHSNFNLNSELSDEYQEILKKLKSANSFKINVEMLFYLINVFKDMLTSSILELYNIDLLKIFEGHKDSAAIISWSLDLENLNKYELKIKKKFFKNILNIIYSKKIMYYETIKQSCIMLRFEKFYFDWFSDSRGRLYCQQGYLNLQGSNISKLLVSPFLDTKLSDKNKDFAIETLSSFFVKHENAVDPLKVSNHFLLSKDLDDGILTSNYALDASSSGLQMLSILLKNENLGLKCGLLIPTQQTDLYLRVSNFIKSEVDNDKSLFKKIKNIQGLYAFIQTRKFSKLPIMTIPYNSTKFGRVDQMFNSFKDFCYLKGIFIKNIHFAKLKGIFFILDDFLIKWCNFEIPECFEFIKSIKANIFSKNFENAMLDNGYCRFNYKMILKNVSRRKIGIKSKKSNIKTKISVLILKNYENLTNKEKQKLKNKINNSFIANLIHNLDSRIAINVLKRCLKENIKIYTIHDCFRIEYNYAYLLRDYLIQAYCELFEYDFLAKNKIKLDNPSISNINIIEFKKKINELYFVKV